MDFIFSWKGYFIMLPIWSIIMILFIKLYNRKLFMPDIIMLMFGCLINPVLTLLAIIVIMLSPMMFISSFIE